MIAAISTATREVMLDSGTILPVIRLYDADNQEVEDWDDATSFLCGPHLGIDKDDLSKKAYYKVDIAAMTVAEVAN